MKEKIKQPETPQEALEVITKALILAQKNGLFELGDSALIYTSLMILNNFLEDKNKT